MVRPSLISVAMLLILLIQMCACDTAAKPDTGTTQESANNSNATAKDEGTKQKLKFFVCYLISKQYLVDHNAVILKTIAGPSQVDLYQKLIGRTMVNCITRAQYNLVEKIMGELKAQKTLKQLKLSQYGSLLNISLKEFDGSTNETVSLTHEEDFVMNLTRDFERELNNRNTQNTDYSFVNEGSLWGEPEIIPDAPTLGGIDFSETSGVFQVFYIGIVLVILVILFYFGYRNLFAKEPTQKKKTKKDKQDSASKSKKE